MITRLVGYLGRHHVGLLALFIALSGTAYAASLPRNSVGSAQLRSNAVTSAKVKNHSLTAVDFAGGQFPAGARGPQGAAGVAGRAGAAGIAGAQGPMGAQGPAGIVAVTARTSALQASPVTEACLPGQIATGGGAVAPIGSLVIESQPVTDGSGVPRAWTASAASGAGNGAALAPVIAWVVCALPS